MPDPSWAEGYVVDIGYTHGYFNELSPSSMNFITLLDGVRAIEPISPFTYYELGCGNGRSTALHAAANPAGQFIGVDFNPMHIRNARDFAEEAGIGNVRFLEKNFAELLEMELPEADMVAMHGVHSWISEENRRQVVEFLRRRLKPGGLFYISYNCLPGQAQVAPLQRLLTEYANLGGGTLPERIHGAIDFARRLEQAGADYFPINPYASSRLARMDGEDPSYLAHEYFNANWAPAYHADVARELAAAKLTYVGSAIIMDNFNQFVLKPEVAKLLAGISDRTMIETLKDFSRNQVFRRDVFARGAAKMSAAELEAMLDRTRFSLLRPRVLCKLKGKTPLGEVSLQQDAYAPVLDALARMPMTFADLAGANETSRMNRTQIRQALFGLAALGNVAAALPADGEASRRAATDRYNAAVIARAASLKGGAILASPVLGAGVPAGFIDLLLLTEAWNEDGAVDRVMATISRHGHSIRKDGKVLDTDTAIREQVETRARSFFAELLPFFRMMGVAA